MEKVPGIFSFDGNRIVLFQSTEIVLALFPLRKSYRFLRDLKLTILALVLVIEIQFNHQKNGNFVLNKVSLSNIRTNGPFLASENTN